MDVWPASLTQKQAWYLSDALQAPYPVFEEDLNAGWRQLLLKIFSAVINNSGQPVPVAFSKSELWTIHEVAKTNAMLGPEKVGLELLAICAEGLLALEADAGVHAAITQVGDSHSSLDELSEEAARRRLAELNKRGG